MKQTAVKWLEENLLFEPWAEEHFKHNKECWNKAKEMEHEQMEFFYKQGHLNSGCPYALEEVYLKRFEDESNETFKSE